MLGFIQVAYLFAAGSMIGWVLEFFYRRFFDPTNPERKWLNPGFLTGPYLPIYGLALILLYYLSRIERFIGIDNFFLRKGILFVIMALSITAMEYVTGLIFIVKLKIMLWDYRGYKGNIKGVICPLYTFFWLLLSFFYCFVIDPAITEGVEYLLGNLQFSFFVGLYCGVFFIDLFISLNNIVNIAEFAREHNIIVYIDELRAQIQSLREKPLFFAPLRFSDTLNNSLERYREYREKHDIKEAIKDNVRELKDKGKELGEGLVDKGREIKEGVKDKGREIKEGVKDKGRELKDGAKDKVERIKKHIN